MSLTVVVSVDRGATVVHVRGRADATSVAARRAWLAAAAADARLVVVDLDGTTAAAPQAVRDLVSALGAGPPRVRLVARRNSVVTLLARGRIHHVFAVHRSIDDAIAAHRAAIRAWSSAVAT